MSDLSPHLPHASKSFRRLNPGLFADEPEPARKPAHRRASRDPKLERDSGDAPIPPGKGPSFYTTRVHVRLVVYRKRALDPCNESSKWLVDCLRYFRILQDDRLSDITLEVDQRPAGKSEERTEIFLTPISHEQ